MRSFPFLASAALALGLVFGAPTQAHASDLRVFVSLGDVMFSSGRPYHRHHNYPLHVVHASHGPRYYYTAPPPPRHYRHPHQPAPVYGYHPGYRHGHAYGHAYGHGYGYRPAPPPPPPRPGYHRHRRPGY